MKSSFYLGRPTRGAKLVKIGSVIWSGNFGYNSIENGILTPHPDETPWRIDQWGVPISTRIGFHRIDRHQERG